MQKHGGYQSMKFLQLNYITWNSTVMVNRLLKAKLLFKVKGYNIYSNEANCENRRTQPWVIIFDGDHARPVIPN